MSFQQHGDFSQAEEMQMSLELGLALQLNTSLTTLCLGEFRFKRRIKLVRFVCPTEQQTITTHSRIDQCPLCCTAEVQRWPCGFAHDLTLAKS
jgi:hypothetical protein